MEKYTLKTNFAALKVPQANEYLMDFGKIIEKAFEYSDSRPRLLGNLLVLERYCNTVQQGLAYGMKHSFLHVCDMRRGFSGIIWADVSQRRISRTLQMIIMHGFPKREF